MAYLHIRYKDYRFAGSVLYGILMRMIFPNANVNPATKGLSVALKQMPLSRLIGNLGLNFLIKAASGSWNIFYPTNDYTAIRNETLKNISVEKLHKRYFFESSMLIEWYHASAVVQDVPMKARYGEEVSDLSRTETLFKFPSKLLKAFIRRIILKYFLYDFNIASIYRLLEVPFFMLGSVYGLGNYVLCVRNSLAAPTGTVVFNNSFNHPWVSTHIISRQL